MADVLRETSLNDSQREIVDTLTTSANLLLAQIEDVLDVAKIEAGRIQIEARSLELGKLLTSTVKVVLPQARYKGLSVNTEIAPATARWFTGDATTCGKFCSICSQTQSSLPSVEKLRSARLLSQATIPERECASRFKTPESESRYQTGRDLRSFHAGGRFDHSNLWRYRIRYHDRPAARNVMGGTIGMSSAVGVGGCSGSIDDCHLPSLTGPT
jgi:hypothetical protein